MTTDALAPPLLVEEGVGGEVWGYDNSSLAACLGGVRPGRLSGGRRWAGDENANHVNDERGER